MLHWRVVDYNDKNALAVALRGTHTLLSFVQPLSETGYQSQKNLIDASIVAQVTRFAPSEWYVLLHLVVYCVIVWVAALDPSS